MLLKLMTYYHSSYALWLSGQGIPNDRSGYANITNWFKVEGGHEEASSGHEEGSSAHAMSTGQIAGVVVGIAMVVTLIAAAVLVLRRRAPRKAPRVTLVEAHPRESFDSIMDEKAEAKLAMRQVDVWEAEGTVWCVHGQIIDQDITDDLIQGQREDAIEFLGVPGTVYWGLKG